MVDPNSTSDATRDWHREHDKCGKCHGEGCAWCAGKGTYSDDQYPSDAFAHEH